MSEQRHIPVMRDRVVELLRPAVAAPGAVVVDCTLGLGGHSEAFLSAFPDCRLIGIDRDPHALELSRERLAPFGDRATLVHAVYDEIGEVLEGLGIDGVHGIFFDLGVSSMQLDEADRGFAYAQDAPLDMRMDDSRGRTAADVLNEASVGELTRILKVYGEEKFARRIAERIERERAVAPFTTSGRLVELLYDAIPAPARRTGGHPAKRTFQALRIEVNDELRVLERAVPAALAAVVVGGRVVVESYQSLEDRLVKQAFTAATRSEVPPDMPVVPAGMEPEFRPVIRGAEQASEEETTTNPRAASVRLRAVERVQPPRKKGGRA